MSPAAREPLVARSRHRPRLCRRPRYPSPALSSCLPVAAAGPPCSILSTYFDRWRPWWARGSPAAFALQALPCDPCGRRPEPGIPTDLAIAPGVAPWVSGRVGIVGSNEGGLTYSGHALRFDLRHAFEFGKGAALSIGLGGTAVIARRPGEDNANGVYGGGADLPVLIGLRSSTTSTPSGSARARASNPRRRRPAQSEFAGAEVTARHFYGGLTAGMRVGFRHITSPSKSTQRTTAPTAASRRPPRRGPQACRGCQHLRPCSRSRSRRPERWR